LDQLRKIPLLILLALVATLPLVAQTFRSTVSGIVTDNQGAVIADATVQLTNPATGQVLNAKSAKAGEFIFPEIVPGIYNLTVASSGFQTKKIDNIDAQVTKVESIKVELSVGAENTIVDVAANAIQTDTTSSALVAVIDSKSVQEIPLNGRDFTKLVKFTPGAALLTNSVNGSRVTGINFQIDGADNVDSWNGIVASNQGGIASVAGGLVPIEAIDQFSMQAAGEADQGRNAGANQNMVIKSGTNQIHGDVFYFDRNEFFAAISPVAPAGSRKPFLRNHQGGFTLGGPIWKDHTFLFLAGEIQIAKINAALTDTVLTNAWIADGTTFLSKYGLAPSPLSLNLYHLLYPSVSTSGPATTNNYFAQGTSNYNSYNGIVKLDHHFSDKQTVSARYLGTTGTQTAPTVSDYAEYFQTAPMHIHNYSVIHSYIFTPNLLNQVTFGVNYFLQTFNDADQNFNPSSVGLNLGLQPGIVAAGAPSIIFTGTAFDQTGATQPSGRTDVTGHVTDNLHWTIGRHSLKIGGEFRHSNVNQLYFSSARGTFTFDGTRGPWAAGSATDKTNCANLPTPQVTSTGTCNTQILALADYLNGETTNSSGAKLLQGDAQRVWILNSEDGWVQDNFQATKKLDINYGIRYTVPGAIEAEKNDVYSFVPGPNPGFKLGLYPNYYGGVAPRVGFSWSPLDSNNTVVRGSFGIFYDFPQMSSWVVGTTTNGGANYAQNNPAGPDAAAIFVQSNVQWQAGVDPFAGASAPQVGGFGVDQNFKMPYAEVFSFGIEQQFSKSTLLSVGYVGTEGRRLQVLYDINQPAANGTSIPGARPYLQTAFPNENPTFSGKPLLGINELAFEASSNYNALQATIKQTAWKGVSATLNYTWSKSLDDASSNTTPMNSYNLHQDYGPSTFDGRNNVNGFVYYSVPQLGHFAPKLTQGFQLNALYSYSSGLPVSPGISTDVSRTDQLHDRPNVSGINPYTELKLSSSTSSGRQYSWMTNSTGAFTTPAPGTYGNERRDAYYGPNFRTVDISIFKHTPVTERIMSEFRVEIFNVFNFNNFANPIVSNIGSSTFGLITNTRNGAAAPGIGYGEPFNIQFALKFTF
jgi:Carboxypeptidase regulatory-like domain